MLPTVSTENRQEMSIRFEELRDAKSGTPWVWEKAFHIYTNQDPTPTEPFEQGLPRQAHMYQFASGLPFLDPSRNSESLELLSQHSKLAGRYASGVREFLEQFDANQLNQLGLSNYKALTSIELIKTLANSTPLFNQLGLPTPIGFYTHMIWGSNMSPVMNGTFQATHQQQMKYDEEHLAVLASYGLGSSSGVDIALFASEKDQTTQHSDFFRQEQGQVIKDIPSFRQDFFSFAVFMGNNHFIRNGRPSFMLIQNGNPEIGVPLDVRALHLPGYDWNTAQFGLNPRDGLVISLYDISLLNR